METDNLAAFDKSKGEAAERSVETVQSHNIVLSFRGVTLKLKRIEPGNFMMGSPESELGHRSYETQHRVTLTQGYWLGETVVTQAQIEAALGINPSYFKKGGDYPVENISWYDAEVFCDRVNQLCKDQLPAGYQLDLPTEAQWEYACRAGTTTALNSGQDLTSERGECPYLDEVGWYDENSEGSTHPVGQKKPNRWGLYDMHGNVWEWCRDRYGNYPSDAVTDPVGVSSGSERVARGGGWNDYCARGCRSADRGCGEPSYSRSHLGFRVALVPVL